MPFKPNSKESSGKRTVSKVTVATRDDKASGKVIVENQESADTPPIPLDEQQLEQQVEQDLHIASGGTVDVRTPLPDASNPPDPLNMDAAAPTLPPGFEPGQDDSANPIRDFGGGRPMYRQYEHNGEFKPYSVRENDFYGTPAAATLTDAANAYAKKVWKDSETYQRVRSNGRVWPAGMLSLTSFSKPDTAEEFKEQKEKEELILENAKQFNRWGGETLIANSLSIYASHAYGFSPPPGSVHVDIPTLIKKIKRIERKHGREEIFDDNTNERVIETILLPASTYGIPANTYGTLSLDLNFPTPKAVAKEILTKEEMNQLMMILNYLPSIRVRLSTFSNYIDKLSEEELLYPLGVGYSGYPGGYSGFRPTYIHPEDDKKYMNSLRKVHHFLNNVIPIQMQQDFLKGKGVVEYPTKVNTAYDELRKKSTALRESAQDYIQETSLLANLLESIIEFSEAIVEYFMKLNEEVALYFDFLNEIGVSYKKLVDESEAMIERSSRPF